MQYLGIPAVAAALLLLPATALALGEESFGNAPVTKQPGWATGVLEVVNLESRVYSQWVNGNENFFYRGDALALEEVLRKFAAVQADERRLVLLPGGGKTRSFGGKTIEFNWQFHVPSGIYQAVTKLKLPILTVYINTEKPRGPIDRAAAEQWIRELDHDSFETRQKATHELERLGARVKPLLQQALRNRPSAETSRRVRSLLAKLPRFDADDLVIPKGLTVVTPGDLIEEHLKSLSDSNQYRCALAASGLVELALYSDKIVPALIALLAREKNEYLRRCAASSLGQIGAGARSALPGLKDGLEDAAPNVRAAFQSARDQIEKAKPEPGWDAELKRRRLILEDLALLKKTRPK